MSAPQTCPLCLSQNASLYHHDKKRPYHQCPVCFLVFVPTSHHLSESAEKAEYDKHQNNPQDPGYQTFLSRTVKPLTQRLKTGAMGLDFGCGPGPAVSRLLMNPGYSVKNYDPYYYPDQSCLEKSYDFITLTEVIEHVCKPKQILELLDRMLKPGALLAVMTKRVASLDAFTNWHYKNDPTHIAFYSLATFNWIAETYGWQLEVIDQDVVFFYQKAD